MRVNEASNPGPIDPAVLRRITRISDDFRTARATLFDEPFFNRKGVADAMSVVREFLVDDWKPELLQPIGRIATELDWLRRVPGAVLNQCRKVTEVLVEVIARSSSFRSQAGKQIGIL
jgi:hypothetical protein